MIGVCWGLLMASEPRRRFAVNLLRIRKERAITQDALAKAIGVTAPTISQWENQESWIGDDKLELLARALNCDVGDFQLESGGKRLKPLDIPPPEEPSLQEAIRVVNKNIGKLSIKRINRKKSDR